MALPGILEAVLGHASWDSITAGWRRVVGHKIKITSPLTGQTLRNPERTADNLVVYTVRGTLKHLPTDHRIWLVTQEEVSGQIRPHGFRLPRHNKDRGEWEGWINSTHRRAKIIAVVAPPTLDDFFNYWQMHGKETQWAPIPRLPAECRNKDEVSVDLLP
jgi:hypothetical protein